MFLCHVHLRRHTIFAILVGHAAMYSVAQQSEPVSTFFRNRMKHAIPDDKSEQHLYVLLLDQFRQASRANVEQALPIIDRELQTSMNRASRLYAVGFLAALRVREDGPELLVGQSALLGQLALDPDEAIRSSSLLTLATLGPEHPDLVIPPLKRILSSTEFTNSTGPLAVGILSSYASMDNDVIPMTVQFLQRRGFTSDGRARAIAAASDRPANSDALTHELIDALEDADTRVKVSALVGISKQGPRGIALARGALESKAGDPRESDRVRSLARKAMKGPLGDDPEARSASASTVAP